MAEPLKRSSKKWCSCGYRNRGNGKHEEGIHHKQKRKIEEEKKA